MSIRIERDDYPESPREWDNMGTMIAFHKRYNLGDNGHGFRASDYNSWDEVEKAIMDTFGKDCVILPLFLYDHSGITMNTTGFHCPWDSGQVGFIVASLAKVREAYGVKRVTRKVRERALEALRNEVEVYDHYLTGNVYVMHLDDDYAIGGFFGSDPFTNGMADHVPEELHDELREAWERS